MPLYEMVMICRCSKAENTASALKSVATTILSLGGNVRNIRILGDRIMSKQLIGKEGARHLVGRYVSVLYDGHPSYFKEINRSARETFEGLRTNHYKVKDFISEATNFTKPIEAEAPFIKNHRVQSYEYSQALKVLREEQQKLTL